MKTVKVFIRKRKKNSSREDTKPPPKATFKGETKLPLEDKKLHLDAFRGRHKTTFETVILRGNFVSASKRGF